MINKPIPDCRSFALNLERNAAWVKRASSVSALGGRCQALGAALPSLSQRTPKPPREDPMTRTTDPEAKRSGGSQGSAGSRPQRATWTRAWHSPVHTLQARESRGPLQVRNRSPGTAKPSHAAQPSLWLAFPRSGAAIARGSRRGSCKIWPTGGGLRARARPDQRRRDCGRTRAQPSRGRRSAARMLQCSALAPPTGARGRFLPRRRLPARRVRHICSVRAAPRAAFPFPCLVLGL